jgi:hypothetical protein
MPQLLKEIVWSTITRKLETACLLGIQRIREGFARDLNVSRISLLFEYNNGSYRSIMCTNGKIVVVLWTWEDLWGFKEFE